MSLPLQQFDVSLGGGVASLLLATRPDSGEAARWTLREVPAEEWLRGGIVRAGRRVAAENVGLATKRSETKFCERMSIKFGV